MIRLRMDRHEWAEASWVDQPHRLGPVGVRLSTPRMTRTLASEGGRMPFGMRVTQQTDTSTQKQGEQTILVTVEVIRDLPEKPESSRTFPVIVGVNPRAEYPWTIRVGSGAVLYTLDGLLVPSIKFREEAFIRLFPLADELSELAWRAYKPLIGFRVEGEPDCNILQLVWWQLTAARKLVEPWLRNLEG